jgi:hypothetical protein
VDPKVLNRLHWLYLSQFTCIGDEVTKSVFPVITNLDTKGRPALTYDPIVTNQDTGAMLIISNEPQFHISFHPPTARPLDSIPGAIGADCKPIKDGWVTFSEPKPPMACWKANFLKVDMWITNRENFRKFAMLALGGTNGSATLTPAPTLQLFNNTLQPLELPLH